MKPARERRDIVSRGASTRANERGTYSERVHRGNIDRKINETLDGASERLEHDGVRNNRLCADLGEELAGHVDLVGLLVDGGFGERRD